MRVTRRGGRVESWRALFLMDRGAVLHVFRHPEKPAAGYLSASPGFLCFVSSAELAVLLTDRQLRMTGGHGRWDTYRHQAWVDRQPAGHWPPESMASLTSRSTLTTSSKPARMLSRATT